MIYFSYKFFDRAKEAIKSRRLRWQILSFLYFSSFLFKENHVFNEKDNSSQKVVILEKELDDIDVDDTVNLEIFLDLCLSMMNVGIQN